MMRRPRGLIVFEDPERGFRGWLVFFFYTGWLTFPIGVYYMSRDVAEVVAWWGSGGGPDALWLTTYSVQILVLAILNGATLAGLVLLARGDRRTPAFWTMYSLCSLVAVPSLHVMFAAAEAWTTTGRLSAFPEGWDRDLWIVVVVNGAWALYWARSRRVYLTYGTVGVGWFRFPRAHPADPVWPAT